MKKVIVLFIFIASLSQAQNFEQIDAHALAAPGNVQNDVEKLAAYLVEPASSDLDKIRAFYVWIAQNIAYDVKLFFSSVVSTEEITANDVLKARKSVCQGYSVLFKEMCDIEGIDCFIVPGYSKGYGWDSRKKLTSTDHAWNVVKINDEWKLIDVTWGSGYLNEKSKFEKKFEEKFFLSKPSNFIIDHLPANPMWQFLDCPISLDEFKKDSAEIRSILANKTTCFNYADSIAVFEQLDPATQILNSALAAYRFNPLLSDDVGFAYMSFAYEKTTLLMAENNALSNNEKYELQAEILELYELAKKFFKNSKSDIAKQALQIVNENIRTSKHNLDVFKKILENE